MGYEVRLGKGPLRFPPCVNIFLFVMALLLVSSGIYGLLPPTQPNAFDLKNKRGE